MFVMKESESSDACCTEINCLEMMPGYFLSNEGDFAGFRNSCCSRADFWSDHSGAPAIQHTRTNPSGLPQQWAGGMLKRP